MSRIHEALRKAELEITSFGNEEPGVRTQVIQEESAKVPSVVVPAGMPASSSNAPFSSDDPFDFGYLRAHCPRSRWHLPPTVDVFAQPVNDACAEQFRTLRSKLYALRNRQQLRILLVTSALPREGKSFVVTNLAQAIVRQANSRVLIIDADLRCSSLHSFMGVNPDPGLTNYLDGDAAETAVIRLGEHDEANLSLITSGRAVANPSELLSNGRLKAFLGRLCPAFDWVIIDSPPFLSVSDASILADMCDGLIFVIKAGSTHSAALQKARQEVHKHKVLGVILNAVERRTISYSPAYKRSVGKPFFVP